MKINIVNSFDGSISSWAFSRPNEKEIDEKSVRCLDLPVNEFLCLHLEIESTIIEREIFATERDHVMWAQTSRVNDVLKFEYYKHFVYSHSFEEKRKLMLNENRIGIPQDEYRKHLPLLSLTKYSIIISARKLAKIAKYFGYLSLHCKNMYMFRILQKSKDSILEVLDKVGYTKEVIEKYSFYNILNEDKLDECKTGKLNDIFCVKSKMEVGLRAQLARHRNIPVFKDNLFQLVTSINIHKFDLKSEVEVLIYVDESSLKSIISKRNCWIAHHGLWKDLLSEVNSICDVHSTLPCNSGSCPFEKDVQLRVEGLDPNPPCPIYSKNKRIQLDYSQVGRMIKMVEDDHRGDFWMKKIEELF
jgi:hypothetical protein